MDSLFTSTTVLLTSEYVQLFTPEKLASKLRKVRLVTGVQFSKAKTTYALAGTWEQVNAAFKLLQHWYDNPEDEPNDDDHFMLGESDGLDEIQSQVNSHKQENGMKVPTSTQEYTDRDFADPEALNMDILKQAMIEGGIDEFQSIEDAVQNLQKEVQSITQRHEARRQHKDNAKTDKERKDGKKIRNGEAEKNLNNTKENDALISKTKNKKGHKKCNTNVQLKNKKMMNEPDLKQVTVNWDDIEIELDNDFDIQSGLNETDQLQETDEKSQNYKKSKHKKQSSNEANNKPKKTTKPKQHATKKTKPTAESNNKLNNNCSLTDAEETEQIDKENKTKSLNIKIKIGKENESHYAHEMNIDELKEGTTMRKKVTRKPGDTGYWSRIKITDYNEKHKCPKCDAVLKSRKRFMEHLRRIHIKEFQCEVCQRRFGYPTDLHRHKCVGIPDPNNEQKGKGGRPKREKSTKSVFLPCPECDYIGTSKKRLNGHIRRTHKLGFECDQCDKKFGFDRDLHRHKENVHCEPSHFCDKCSRFYKSKSVFEVHLRTHEDGYVKPNYECQVCSKSFTTKYVLTAHIKTEHLGIKKTYLCQICGKKFSQRNSYKQHSNAHNGIKPYVCDLCGKAFTYHKSLKEHKFMHDNVRRFQCSLCEKAFRQRTTLQIHMKVHKTVKDHICATCSKGFSQKQALERHERIHTGIKPYTCVPCQRTFGDASTIRRHMLAIHQKSETNWREDIICNVKKKTDYYVTGGSGQNRTYKSKSSVNDSNSADLTAEKKAMQASSLNPESSSLNEIIASEPTPVDMYKNDYQYSMSEMAPVTSRAQQLQTEQQLHNLQTGAIYALPSSQKQDQFPVSLSTTLPVNYSAVIPVNYSTAQILDFSNLSQVANHVPPQSQNEMQKDTAVAGMVGVEHLQAQQQIDVQQINNVFQAATLVPTTDGQRMTQMNAGQQVSGDSVLSQAMASIWGFGGYPAYYIPTNMAQFQTPQNQ